jgi:hypothetical protein
MKRFLLVALLVLVAMGVSCQTVYYKSQATLQWDTVTQDVDGNPFLPTDVVQYDVFIYDYVAGVADPQNPALLTFVATTLSLEQLIVFPHRTTWAAGVRVRLTDAGTNVSYSPIAWSYIVADADVVLGPFVYSPLGGPKKPQGLQDKGM